MKMLIVSDRSVDIYGFSIAIDFETGVNYFYCSGNLFPRYNSNGILYTSSQEEIAKLQNNTNTGNNDKPIFI